MVDTNSTPEVWKPVVGFHLYEVSDLGRMRSSSISRRWGRNIHIVNGALDKNGYRIVMLRIATNKAVQRFLHRLIAEAFIGPIPKGITINHLDAIKTNNRLSNLEFATMRRQYDHARTMGLMRVADRYIKSTRRIDEALVIEIRRRYIRRHKIHGATAMAREFGLRYPTIFSIIKGETWAHIKNTTPTG